MVTNKAIKPQAEKHAKDAEEKMTEHEGDLQFGLTCSSQELSNFPFFFSSFFPRAEDEKAQ